MQDQPNIASMKSFPQGLHKCGSGMPYTEKQQSEFSVHTTLINLGYGHMFINSASAMNWLSTLQHYKKWYGDAHMYTVPRLQHYTVTAKVHSPTKWGIVG